MRTKIIIIGCGYAAGLYAECLKHHPRLKLIGVFDKNKVRTKLFSNHYSVRMYSSLKSVLDDKEADIIVNLTNPKSHYQISRACLIAKKNVYSEKPIALTLKHTKELIRLAKMNQCYLSTAPCNHFGNSAQKLKEILDNNVIGKVSLVYAEIDDGMVFKMNHKEWKSPIGVSWPTKNEFMTGCVIEHAAYSLSCLLLFFGPINKIYSYSDCLISDKGINVKLNKSNIDFSVAFIEFSSGIVARLTCSTIASKNHTIKIFGENGIATMKDSWDHQSPISIKPLIELKQSNKNKLLKVLKRNLQSIKNIVFRKQITKEIRDYALGIEIMANWINGNNSNYNLDFILHLNEAVLAINRSTSKNGNHYHKMKSTFIQNHLL